MNHQICKPMARLRVLIKRLPKLAEEFVKSWNLAKLLIALDAVISYFVIKNVRYTEIDWSTYMVQVGKVFNTSNGFNFNYSQIDGPTGPLVYPAGHLYISYFLKELTDNGTNIRAAQYIFLVIYLAQLALVYKIYSHKRVIKVPPYVFAIMCLASYRIHSIYILRLFNDPIAILITYASFYALLCKNYTISSFLFSFAIAVKMNILLFAPAFALIFYENLGLVRSIKKAGIAIGTQLLLAAPFLYHDPYSYFNRAFNFKRVFLHEWTVNWRFLDEKTFTSPEFFKILILAHLVVLFVIFWPRWTNLVTLNQFNLNTIKRDDPIMTLFIANFIGIMFSRSLHYQFYIWYYHSLPMILWATRYSVAVKILILGCIEYSWNEYPSTKFSSLLLHASHLAILIGLFLRHNKPVDDSQIIVSRKQKRKHRR